MIATRRPTSSNLIETKLPRDLRIIQWRPKTLALLATAAMFAISSKVGAQDFLKEPNNYMRDQTFMGKAFRKDNNIWVYTEAFAKEFGMPPQWVNEELIGVEAAAFRVEESSNAKLCGLGGKEDQCDSGGNCMLDIYVDEKKHLLPWREPEQKSDWIKQYNSSN